MPNLNTNDLDRRGEEALSRFVQSTKDLTMDSFDDWASGDLELQVDDALRGAVRDVLESSPDLMGKLLESAPSVFGPRGGSSRSPQDESWSAAARLAPGQRIAQFVLERFIARGGMGQVWEAVDTDLDRTVALKFVLPGRVDDTSLGLFAREARAGGRLHHPGIVTTLSHGTDDNLSWIAQEFVAGSWTLKHALDELRAGAALPAAYFPRTAQLIALIADALHAAHEAGVVHRDVKPGNILIDDDDRPRLTDFGLARIDDDSRMSDSGQIAGTWAYMSPEQASGDRSDFDRRSDVFSLGVMLYETLTLRRPFEGDSPHQISQQVLHGEPIKPSSLRSQCPPDLSLIALKALEKSPSARYQTADALARDLRAHLAHQPISARPLNPMARSWKWVRRHPTVGAVGALGLLALIVVSTLLVHNSDLAATAIERAKDLEVQTGISEQRANVAAELASVASNRASEVLRLSALQDIDTLLAEEQDLWPPSPGSIPELKDWLGRAEELVVQRPDHVATLENLRGKIEATTDPQERRELSWWVAQLVELNRRLDNLEGELISPKAHTEKFGWSVGRRLAWAQGTADEFKDGGAASEAWKRGAAAIALAYPGLDLPPQTGLLPLGPDPESGLWEFAHMQSGKAPERGADGALAMDLETAIILVLIPEGEFTRGAQSVDPDAPHYAPDARADESPVHRTTVSAFFMSKYEVTQRQWTDLAGRNPSAYNAGLAHFTWMHPVERVSWEDCVGVLPRASLVLPSEVQWEYAARAGSPHRWSTGNRRESLTGYANLADQAAAKAGARWAGLAEWPEFEDGHEMHSPIGALRPNAFGLHDTIGNVIEWTYDQYVDTTYQSCASQSELRDFVLDPSDSAFPAERRYRSVRGGAFNLGPSEARCARRGLFNAMVQHWYVGVRPARAILR